MYVKITWRFTICNQRWRLTAMLLRPSVLRSTWLVWEGPRPWPAHVSSLKPNFSCSEIFNQRFRDGNFHKLGHLVTYKTADKIQTIFCIALDHVAALANPSVRPTFFRTSTRQRHYGMTQPYQSMCHNLATERTRTFTMLSHITLALWSQQRMRAPRLSGVPGDLNVSEHIEILSNKMFAPWTTITISRQHPVHE